MPAVSATAPVSASDPRGSTIASRVRELADRAFSRAAGAPVVAGNGVRLLRDAAENYPAWLEAIATARRHVHFENYIICEDATGAKFAEALIERAQAGVPVRLIYDWLGGLGNASRAFWSRLRAGGVDVRCYNPPRFDSPLGWLSRDHRKVLTIDGAVGFVAGLCVGQAWAGDPAKHREPWRDTGVEIRGPAVADIERAFRHAWSMLGEPLPGHEPTTVDESPPAGEVCVRIVASEPAVAGTFRLDQLVVAFARQRVWLTDAYYLGTPMYMQALITAARDGVDVRLLLPGASDLPLVRSLSRTGYRPLLEAGVRIFEWNGVMLHAKTAVVDGRWSRVGSTNLNLASWLGNCEMDAVMEDEPFAQAMEAMYLEDLANATEVVLNEKRKVRAPGRPPTPRRPRTSGGSTSRAAAGAMRLGNALGAAIANRRTMESPEKPLMIITGLMLFAVAAGGAFFPRIFAYPVAAVLAWLAIALIWRGRRTRRSERGKRE